jgi:hypothetical protein
VIMPRQTVELTPPATRTSSVTRTSATDVSATHAGIVVITAAGRITDHELHRLAGVKIGNVKVAVALSPMATTVSANLARLATMMASLPRYFGA